MKVIPKGRRGGRAATQLRRESCGIRGIFQRGGVGGEEEYELDFRHAVFEL